MDTLRSAPRVGTTSGRARLPLTWLVATAVLWESSTFYLVVPLASQLTDQLELTKQTLSLLQAAHVIGTLAASFLTPPLVHRFAARTVFVGGMVAFALALALWPLAGTAAFFIVARFCSGTAGGVVWIAGVVWLGEVQDPDEIGRNSGFVMAYTLLGSAAGPLFGTLALHTSLAAVCGCMVGVSLATAGVAARRKPAIVTPAIVTGRVSRRSGWLGFALVTVPLLVTCVAAGARFSLLPLDLQRAGMSPSNIGISFGLAGLVMAAIAIPVGYGVDRLGERRVLAASLATLSLSAATLATALPLAAMVVAGTVLAASLQVAWTPLLAMASRESVRHGLSQAAGIAALNVVWTVGILGGTALLAGAGMSTAVFWVAVAGLCAAMLAVLPLLRIGYRIQVFPRVAAVPPPGMVGLMTDRPASNLPFDSALIERTGPVAVDRRSRASGLTELGVGFAEFVEPGATEPRVQPYEEALYVVAGELTVIVGDDTIVGHPGDLITVEKGTEVSVAGAAGTRLLYSIVPANWRELTEG